MNTAIILSGCSGITSTSIREAFSYSRDKPIIESVDVAANQCELNSIFHSISNLKGSFPPKRTIYVGEFSGGNTALHLSYRDKGSICVIYSPQLTIRNPLENEHLPLPGAHTIYGRGYENTVICVSTRAQKNFLFRGLEPLLRRLKRRPDQFVVDISSHPNLRSDDPCPSAIIPWVEAAANCENVDAQSLIDWQFRFSGGAPDRTDGSARSEFWRDVQVADELARTELKVDHSSTSTQRRPSRTPGNPISAD